MLDISTTYNAEAEMSVLGSVIVKPKCADDVFMALVEEDFYLPAHQIIYRAMRSLDAVRMNIDIVTVKNKVNDFGLLQDIGGEDYLIQVAESVPGGSNATSFADIVKAKRVNRELLEASQTIQAIVAADVEPERKINKAQDILQGINQSSLSKLPQTVGRVMLRMIEGYESDTPPVRLPTGFADVDQMLDGYGLGPGDLTVVAGRTSMGKTAFASKIALHAARSGKKVGFFSLEMSAEQIARRMISLTGDIEMGNIGRMDDHQDRWRDAAESNYELNIMIDEQASIDHLTLGSKARWMSRQMNGLDLIVVDYIQLMNPVGKVNSVHEGIGQTTKGLKALGKDLGVPVVALSQLNRESESKEDRRPSLKDLRGSGSIEEDADQVFALYRPNYYRIADKKADADVHPDRVEIAEVLVLKNRNGAVGTVDVVFIPRFAKYANLSK